MGSILEGNDLKKNDGDFAAVRTLAPDAGAGTGGGALITLGNLWDSLGCPARRSAGVQIPTLQAVLQRRLPLLRRSMGP
jgi:hypothetical protein